MKKKRPVGKMILMVTLAVFAVGMIWSLGTMSSSLQLMQNAEVTRSASAILADKGVTDGQDVTLSATFVDQRQDECVDLYGVNNVAAVYARQFEWTSCGYTAQGVEEGTVDYYLGADGVPVANGGKLLANRGIAKMERWWTTMAEKSREHAGMLKLKYNAEEAEFSYVAEEFFPVDKLTFSDGDLVNADGHNHLFTMNVNVPFEVSARGNEGFEITADDDTYVYVNDRLALDMGGIHAKELGKFLITREGEVHTGVGEGTDLAYSGITVGKGEKAIIRIFHADRDTGTGSVLEMKLKEMKVEMTGAKIATVKKDEGITDKAEIATKTADGYEAPLGKSVTVGPSNNIRADAIMMTMAGVMLMISACFGGMLLAKAVKGRVTSAEK